MDDFEDGVLSAAKSAGKVLAEQDEIIDELKDERDQLRSSLRRQTDTIDHLHARVAELETALTKLEWSQTTDVDDQCCPACGERQFIEAAHTDDCWLNALIAKPPPSEAFNSIRDGLTDAIAYAQEDT